MTDNNGWDYRLPEKYQAPAVEVEPTESADSDDSGGWDYRLPERYIGGNTCK